MNHLVRMYIRCYVERICKWILEIISRLPCSSISDSEIPLDPSRRHLIPFNPSLEAT